MAWNIKPAFIHKTNLAHNERNRSVCMPVNFSAGLTLNKTNSVKSVRENWLKYKPLVMK